MMHTRISPTEAARTVTANPAEAQLANDIGDLWQVHAHYQSSLLKNREELKRIRQNLSNGLNSLKIVLSRVGRGGAWSSFLESQRIPRSTADRLVCAYVKSVAGLNGNIIIGQIVEPSELAVRRCVAGWWPKLLQTLTTLDAVEMFIAELRSAAEMCFDTQQGAAR